MAKIQSYKCGDCSDVYEFMHHPSDEPAVCPKCGSTKTEVQLGTPLPLHVIIPVYPNSKRLRAGYVHTHGDRPKEKISVSVPRKL
jgi:putative FmdB family regulatory protein